MTDNPIVSLLSSAANASDKIKWAADEIKRQRAENARLREALKDMLNGWRYIRETYGDLAGVGWDRAEQKALSALEGKP